MHRGWAALLCIYLLGWVPLRFASAFLSVLPSLDVRGAPALVEIGINAIVTMLCAAAGWMVWTRAPAAAAIASAAVIASGAVMLASLVYTVLPSNVGPGERAPLAILIAAHTIFWLVMLRRRTEG